MLTSINAPSHRTGPSYPVMSVCRRCRLPKSTCIFIPAHLAEELVITSEVDRCSAMIIWPPPAPGNKKYLAREIDSEWSDAIKKDFSELAEQLSAAIADDKEELDDYLKSREIFNTELN